MKLKNILGAVVSTALCLGAWSCTDEVEYTPTPAFDGDEVFFYDGMNTSIALPLDATEFEVVVNRLRSDDALTVGITSEISAQTEESVSDVFSVPASVSFAAGEKTATIKVGVDFAKVVPSLDYKVVLSIDDATATPYGDSSVTLNVSYAPWTDWTRLNELGNFQQAGMWDYNYDNYVYYRKSLVNDNLEQYAIGGPFSDFEYDYVFTVDKSHVFDIDGDQCYFVTMESIETPLNNSDGYPYILSDVYTWLSTVLNNDNYEDIQKLMTLNNFTNSYFNPSAGLIVLNQVRWATNIEAGNAYSIANNYLQLGGYANYELDFSMMYNIVDVTGKESVVIQGYKSDDVKSYAYSIVPGKLDESAIEAEVAAIKADTDATLYTETQQYITYSPSEEGDYTLVAVGYNEAMDEVCHTAYTFTYKSVQVASEWESMGTAIYTDGFLYPFYNGIGGETWNVEVERHKTNANLIRIVNAYKSAYWPSGNPAWDLPGDSYITINIENPNQVYIEESSLGVVLSSQDGEISVNSYAAYFMQNDIPADAIAAEGYFGKYEDGVITFPGASLLIGWALDPSGWSVTNFDMDKNVYILNEAGKPVGIDYEAQLSGTGWFELNLTSVEAAQQKVTAKKNVPAEVAKNEIKLKKIPAAKKAKGIANDAVKEYVKNNFDVARKYIR